MAGRITKCCQRLKRDKRANLIVGALFLLIAAMATTFFLTNDEKPQAVSAPVLPVNAEYNAMETNPLTLNLDQDVTNAVKKYYERQKENSDYAEHYANLNVYMKKGKLKDTYVVFARYDMKIKDIYTPVPGLGTLYADKDKKGNIRIDAQTDNENIQQVISALTAHKDVASLFTQVQEAYTQAVQSDAILAEAVGDLQQAIN